MNTVTETKAARVKAELNWTAWRDFISWAAGEPDMLLRYERDTGKKIIGPTITLISTNSQLLEEQLARDFTVWVTKTYWGEEDAPPEYHELVKRWNKS